MNIGDMGVPFIYQGEELIYPEYVKDGLVLHYDFSGMTNNDASKDIARDLSGNGNHGTLQNFNFTPESGYDKNKLLFDGVDDYIVSPGRFDNIYTQEVTATFTSNDEMYSTLSATLNHRKGEESGFAVTIALGDRIRINLGTGTGLSVNSLSYTGVNIGDKFHVVAVVDNLMLKVYINGVFNQEFKLLSFDPIQKEATGFYVGRYGTSYDFYKAKGNIFSTKAYNRPLAPEEIAHNYAIEKERFGIE